MSTLVQGNCAGDVARVGGLCMYFSARHRTVPGPVLTCDPRQGLIKLADTLCSIRSNTWNDTETHVFHIH